MEDHVTAVFEGVLKGDMEVTKEAGMRESVKIIVGGAPISDEYAAQIGADGYAPDAGRAARLARKLMA